MIQNWTDNFTITGHRRRCCYQPLEKSTQNFQHASRSPTVIKWNFLSAYNCSSCINLNIIVLTCNFLNDNILTLNWQTICNALFENLHIYSKFSNWFSSKKVQFQFFAEFMFKKSMTMNWWIWESGTVQNFKVAQYVSHKTFIYTSMWYSEKRNDRRKSLILIIVLPSAVVWEQQCKERCRILFQWCL